MQRNEPLLAGEAAPWSQERKRWAAFKPSNLRETFDYIRKHRMFSAPSSMSSWRYRELLCDLDDPCLRSLRSHGALTARELADWINREGLLRTKPKRTGIHCISVATVHDWIKLAQRRAYVVAWQGGAGMNRAALGGIHWELTRGGEDAIRSKFARFMSRVNYGVLVSLLAAGGGAFAVLHDALNWLSVRPTAIVVTFYSLLLTLYISALVLWFSRSERRENPGFAVVAIETLRCAGKPVPVL